MKLALLNGLVCLVALGIMSCGGEESTIVTAQEYAEAVCDVESVAEDATWGEAAVGCYGENTRGESTMATAVRNVPSVPTVTINQVWQVLDKEVKTLISSMYPQAEILCEAEQGAGACIAYFRTESEVFGQKVSGDRILFYDVDLISQEMKTLFLYVGQSLSAISACTWQISLDGSELQDCDQNTDSNDAALVLLAGMLKRWPDLSERLVNSSR